MKLRAFLAGIPDRVYILCFAGVICLASAAAYFLYQDTALLEKKIISKQKEISYIQSLRQTYEAKKQALEGSIPNAAAPKGMSLAAVEEIATRSLVGGRLTALRPVSSRSEKERKQPVVEVKVSGAPLGEVVSFLQAIDSAGFRLKKIQLSLPGTGQTLLEMQASLVDGRTRE